MVARRLLIVVAAVVLAALTALPTLAGGWAVVTLDHLPARVIAGEPVTIGFMVRQHGRHPTDGLHPRITATHVESGEAVHTTAVAEGATGHYVATLAFPNEGEWRWAIDAFSFAQPMPALTVHPAGTVGVGDGGKNAARSSLLVVEQTVWPAVGILGLTTVVVVLIVSQRKRLRFAPALALVAAAIGLAGFVAVAQRPVASASQGAAPAPADLGRDLFLAKGCVVCHQHAAVAETRQAFASFAVGPDLTNYPANPDFLEDWLKDPAAVRPTTSMPTLGLSDQEIEALIAFLMTKVER
jgi:mono/diheme cytochrome c family protein